MSYQDFLIETFLVVVAGYFGWLTAMGYQSGRVTALFGGFREYSRDSGERTYWFILGWYALVALGALVALSALL